MGRYKEKETTKFSDTIPIPPPSVYRFEVEDTKTARIGEGVGLTKKEARDNAWKNLKFGEEPKYREKPISSSGGGGGSDTSLSFPDLDFSVGMLAMILLAIALVALPFFILDTEVIPRIETNIIKRVYPAYETREEKYYNEKQKWERWEGFIQSSEKWLVVSETTPVIPQGKIIFLSRQNGNKRIFSMNLDSTSRINLTRGFSGEISGFTFSPNNEEVAFISTKGRNREIYQMDSSSRIIQITKTTDGRGYENLAWLSPSVILATRQVYPELKTIWQIELSSVSNIPAIAFLRIPTLKEFNDKWMKEASGISTRTSHNCQSPSVSPDKTKLAYIKTKYQSFGYTELAIKSMGEIVVRNLQNSRKSVYSGMDAIHITSQAWSPDASKIVFTGGFRYYGEMKNVIGILELRGRKVSYLRVFGDNPAWSPDGKWIAFDYEGEIYIFEIAAAKTETVPTSLGFLTGSEIRIVSGNIRKVAKGEKPLWIK